MEKIYGISERHDGLERVGRCRYVLYYGLYTDADGRSYEYRHTFDHAPGWEEVRGELVELINGLTRAAILNGFEWSGEHVWLSDENQRNFMMMEKLTEEEYPLSVKINERGDGKPVYHIFVSEEEFAAFSKQVSQHVKGCLEAGWEEKDSLDKGTFGF